MGTAFLRLGRLVGGAGRGAEPALGAGVGAQLCCSGTFRSKRGKGSMGWEEGVVERALIRLDGNVGGGDCQREKARLGGPVISNCGPWGKCVFPLGG